MLYQELPIAGAYRIDLQPIQDERGFFARAFCQRELAERGLPQEFPQSNISYSRRRGTLRGIHYRPDGREAKLIRCIAGAVFDVIVDLRTASSTYGAWSAVELTAENRAMVSVPPGCGHGHQALTDDAELFYQMGDYYVPGSERGVRWDDPALAIDWPMPPTVISPRDAGLPFLTTTLEETSP